MSALEIATDLYRTLWTTIAKKEDKILNGRSRRESSERAFNNDSVKNENVER